MSKWRVYNRHPDNTTHREKFRGDDVVIPGGEYVLMDYEDAIQFKGQYFPIRLTGENIQARDSYKCIELKADGEAAVPAPFYVSPVDGKKFNSQQELDAYIKGNFSHLDNVQDAAQDAEIAKKGKK